MGSEKPNLLSYSDFVRSIKGDLEKSLFYMVIYSNGDYLSCKNFKSLHKLATDASRKTYEVYLNFCKQERIDIRDIQEEYKEIIQEYNLPK